MWLDILVYSFLLLLGYGAWETASLARHSRFSGPRQYPIIGNVLSTRKLWLTLAALGKEYGPIYSLRTFRTHMLVLNNSLIAREILDNKSTNYWGRPYPKMLELSGMTRGIVFGPDGGRLRLSRKMLNLVLNSKQLEQYHPVVERYVIMSLKQMLQTPHEFPDHIRSIPTGITMELAYGHQSQGAQDPFVIASRLMVQRFARANRLNFYAVDWFPFLERLPCFLPGMSFKRDALLWFDENTRAVELGFALGQHAVKRGLARPTFAELAMKKLDEFPLDLIKYNATAIYSGGSDTTISIVLSYFLMMLRHPDVQLTAQAEIDSVIGNIRLPRYSDRADLPYTNAVITEVARCFPPTPILTRSPAQDDIHEGKYISKGTIVVANLWGMLHDESVYPNPDEFKPERWLSAKADDKLNPLQIVFGFGRRVCPGRYLAEEMLFMAIASTIATMNILPELGSNGELIVPAEEYTDGGLTYPKPFKCRIQPRSKNAHDLIVDAVVND